MATPSITWILSVLLSTLTNCCAAAGPCTPPSAKSQKVVVNTEDNSPRTTPSPPECYRPCEERQCSLHIQCIWDPRPDPNTPTKYSLHWEPANNEEGHSTSRNSSNGLILREHYFNEELHVWVQASNQHGSAKSQKVVVNTQDIIKPPPPKFSSSHQDPLEIHWSNACSELLGSSIGLCHIRHRTEENQDWLECTEEYYGSYTIDDPQPGTAYEFQVRCSCHRSLMSDWSEIHRIKSAELAPVGQVNVWRDCEMFTTSFDCFLTWKNLSISQARGVILGYNVSILYNNGTVELMDLSTTNQSRQFVCDKKKKCHLTSSLKNASSVTISAYSALGATVPSNILMPTTGIEEKDIHLDMNERNLTVSWDTLTLSGNLTEYVVQYKQAGCPPSQEFDWLKLNKSLTTAFFQGQFKNHTPYQVSLFAVSHNGEVHQLSSVIGYSHQGAPSKVPLFKAASIATTEVTLFWEPIPLCNQTGLILYYQIGVSKQKVYNVSASPQHGNQTFKLLHLTPGQEYEVWIKAVTAVGAGANHTISFKTKHHEDFARLIPVMTGIFMLVIVICLYVFFLSSCQEENKVCPLLPSLCFYEKVPDPRNSRIFRQMKHQINEPLAWLCIPIFEPHHKISLVEVVEKKSQSFECDKLTKPVVGDGCSQMDFQDDQRETVVAGECDRTDHRYGREEYSKMLDSDEERDVCWSSSEEEPFSSGYEKHFMPTDLEILEV
ncbi:interleukin 12 receptor, beta 2a, like [Mugil cephalus]|uniref:interleukin 12 receptor, beta 2a, like n=1 Tax=Mugil cephalus TaxID=48193 RepID=UPI001FB63EA6|nr:interleukin 12 receptor, beta 2a, like [Mugil cephalus]